MTILMIKYVYKILEDCIEVIKTTAATTARDNLFQVRAEELAEHVPEELTVSFHHAMTQLVFLSQRAHRDIHLPVSSMTYDSKSEKTDRDDSGKLPRVL